MYIGVQTTAGFRYLYYTPSNNNLGINTTNNYYIHHGIGTNLKDGAWHTTTRNLEADLQEFEPSNEIISVNGFLIRGSGRLDNIALINTMPPPPVPAQIVYEDAENSDTEGWSIYDSTPEGASIHNVFDTEKIIENN